MTEREYLENKKKHLMKYINDYKCILDLGIEENKFDIKKDLCNKDLCSKCTSCCLRSPCIFSPYDFIDITDLDYMRNILDTGLITITRIRQSRLIVLRPRGYADSEFITTKVVDYDYAEGSNPCFLENNGCLFNDIYRPTQGLLYYPREKKRCLAYYTEIDYEREYNDYQKLLESLFYEYMDKEVPKFDSLKEEVNKLTKRIINK